MKQIDYQPRNCDLCGSERLEELWAYEAKARTKSDVYAWSVRNVVCTQCGFAFVSPCPTESSLTEYYADSHEHWQGQSLDYSVEKRIELLRKHLPANADFVEIGGNNNAGFRDALAGLVASYANVEPNRNCGGQFQSVESLPPASADVLAAYFVLEHAPSPAAFLASCVAALRDGGTLVVEVPNLYIYPLDPAGLNWWEHTSHFSPRSLTRLAAAAGFRLVEISYGLCSRPFGFAAVFRKAGGAPAIIADNACEYYLAVACVRDARSRIDAYHARLAEVRQRVHETIQAGGGVVLWAANRVCLDLLGDEPPPEGVIVVDSNPQKAGFLQTGRVYQPMAATDTIRKAKLIVINTAFHAEAIIRFVREIVGRTLEDGEMMVMDEV